MKTRYQVALPISLLVLTILCGFFLSSTIVKADDTTSDSVSIQIDIACTITTGGGTYSDTIDPGTYKEITGNPINVSCNDPGGYALYAIGFSGDSYDAPDNNKMLGPNSNYIPTANSGSSSYWAMKVAGSSSSSAVPTIDNSYSSYQIIPATYTEVSHYPSSTVGTTTNSVTTPTYKVNISSAQPAGTYTGKVKYTMVHPNTAPAPVPPQPTLYDTVAKMSKGTQTLADMQAVITKPTSNNPATDTSNSGVYEYDAITFGAASDAANTHKIYYYRGILDSNLTDSSGTDCTNVGSCGDGYYYPNYVVLSSASNKGSLTTSNTCWRIVRTTGSGGVKMIYNGKWTGSTCANADSSANAVSSVYFNRRSSSSTDDYGTKGRIIYVGYNYSSTSSHQTDTSAVSNSTLFVNNTASNLRTQLESWYASNMTSYTSKLETNAGWCNDRTTYNSSYTSQSSTVPYATSSATVYFGAYKRNMRSGQNEKLSLTCTNSADRLTTSNGMTYPAAPLTADEAALAGSGYSGRTSAATTSSNYHYNSYLRSGGNFWLLSPSSRTSSGTVSEFDLTSNGYLYVNFLSNTPGVRPSISLNPGTTAVSGTGTATDPWIVNP